LEGVAEPVAQAPEIAFEREPANAITVPDDLRITHSILRQKRSVATGSDGHHTWLLHTSLFRK
jgi:hypothetical protein